MINMEDYFNMLQEAAAQNAARKEKSEDEATNGHNNASNNHSNGSNEPDSATRDADD